MEVIRINCVLYADDIEMFSDISNFTDCDDLSRNLDRSMVYDKQTRTQYLKEQNDDLFA